MAGEEQRHERSIERLFEKVESLRADVAVVCAQNQESAGQLRELRADMRAIRENGCLKASEHTDHESRLRTLEGQGRWSHGLAAGGGGVLVAAVQAIVAALRGQ